MGAHGIVPIENAFLGETGFSYATQGGAYILWPSIWVTGYVWGALYFGRYLMAKSEHVVIRSACIAAIVIATSGIALYAAATVANLSKIDIFPNEQTMSWAGLSRTASTQHRLSTKRYVRERGSAGIQRSECLRRPEEMHPLHSVVGYLVSGYADSGRG